MANRQLLKGIAALGAATLVGEFLYAHHRGLPDFPDHDCSTVLGNPSSPRVDILALGDSAMTGKGLDDPDDIFLRIVARELADRYHVHLESLAVGGARSLDVLHQQLPFALHRRWDVAVLSCGINDMMHAVPFVIVERRLEEIVDELRKIATIVVLTGVGDVGTAPRAPFPLSAGATAIARTTDRMQQRIARSRDFVMKAPMWELSTPVFRSGDDLFAADLFHPNEAGNRVWAGAIGETIEAAVDQAVAARR